MATQFSNPEREKKEKNFKGREEKLSQLYYRDLLEGHIAGGTGGWNEKFYEFQWKKEIESFVLGFIAVKSPVSFFLLLLTENGKSLLLYK